MNTIPTLQQKLFFFFNLKHDGRVLTLHRTVLIFCRLAIPHILGLSIWPFPQYSRSLNFVHSRLPILKIIHRNSFTDHTVSKLYTDVLHIPRNKFLAQFKNTEGTENDCLFTWSPRTQGYRVSQQTPDKQEFGD